MVKMTRCGRVGPGSIPGSANIFRELFFQHGLIFFFDMIISRIKRGLSPFETCVTLSKAALMSECQPKYLRALDCIDASVIGVQYL